MDQRKTGAFLKQLRKEKNLTQEQLAERFHISGRTVSRWETGSNMPDLSILVELSDFYAVDIREILEGERKSGNMNEEAKDTLKKIAEFTAEEKRQLKRKMAGMMIGCVILLVFCALLFETKGFGGWIPERPRGNMIMFTLGLTASTLVLNTLYLFGILDTIRAKCLRWKQKL